MKLAIKLAYRNLIGAGLRTWLSVIVLSFSFVVIIWVKGILNGWEQQAKTDMKNWETGNGQYWCKEYDPFDPFTLNDSHAPIPESISDAVERGDIEPFLLAQGTIYPQGRMQSVVFKGVNPGQRIFLLPAQKMDTIISGAIPAIAGSVMAGNMKLNVGDRVTIQWRDTAGTFDAAEILLTGIFSTNVPAADQGKIYLPLEKLREMTGLEGQATILTYSDERLAGLALPGWKHKPLDELTRQVDEMIKLKKTGQSVFYYILLLLAMLAIFDTQVLSIFRRQKEIGTYIALGYTRQQVVGLFTVEGTMHACFAAVLAAAYGLPFLLWQAKAGWTMPVDTSQMGIALAQTLYPVFTAGLVISTILLVTMVTAVVSYWPSRRIGRMNPTEALRGRIQ